MRFSDWISLDEISEHAPAKSGLFQLKMQDGLFDYPVGKSAMFYYGYAESLKEGLAFFIEKVLPGLDANDASLLIRWMETEDKESRFRKQMDYFRRNFGSLPLGNEVLLKKQESAG